MKLGGNFSFSSLKNVFGFSRSVLINITSPVAQWERISLPVQETRVRSLGQEAPLEKEMATHPSVLAWRIPWTEEPGGLQSTGSQRVRHD